MFEKFKRKSSDEGNKESEHDHPDLKSGADQVKTVVKSLSENRFRVASCQSTGRERSHNEDTLFVFSTLLNGVDSPISFGLYLVADGMGGHQSGEIASNLAAQTVSKSLIGNFFEAHIYDRQSFSDDDIQQTIKAAIDDAQTMIQHRVPGGGTTLTMVLGINEYFYSGHVGDSRLYLVGSDGGLTLKTKDHSLVKRLVDLGEITENEARDHPQRNVLYRALGQIDSLESDLDHFVLNKGEKLMLCSDGLWGVVEDEQMEEILKDTRDLDRAVEALVRKANEAGGPDNISVVLVERIG